MSLVKDAMVSDPQALVVSATAQEAGEALTRPEVRAVLVVESDGALAGVVTRKTLVGRVVAAGLDPRSTRVGDVMEPPNHRIESSMELDSAFAFLEEHDLERVPVVEDGRLVGVLSRAVIQRRLAEDEPPADPEEVF
jgi:CBS domain-containing protein